MKSSTSATRSSSMVIVRRCMCGLPASMAWRALWRIPNFPVNRSFGPVFGRHMGRKLARLLLGFLPSIGGANMATITTTTAPAERKPLYASLFVQVLAGLILGIVLGVTVPDFAVSLKILSDAFLKLISMIVAPIVFCVVVHGIAGAGDLKKVGRVGVKALVYFETMTTVALVLGIILAFIFGVGHGMNIDTATLDA